MVLLSAGKAVAAGTVDEILAGQVTIEASPPDPAAALGLLETAGWPVLPTRAHLRVPEIPQASVLSVLGDGVGLVESRSSLEEAFMTLAGST